MQQIHFNNVSMAIDNAPLRPVKHKPKARKWREIESVKAALLLAKELREIDSSYSFSPSDLY